MKAVANRRLHANQDTLDSGDDQPARGDLPILSSHSGYLWEVLERDYRMLRFDRACGKYGVFQALVPARLRAHLESGHGPGDRRGRDTRPGAAGALAAAALVHATDQCRARLSVACAAHVGLGPATVLLYDVTTPHFETTSAHPRETGTAAKH